jgi:glycosyltransferase involved in cell wall biosynthesis
MKKLICITIRDLSSNPFPELALPVLVRNGWKVTLVAPNVHQSVLNRCLPYACWRHNVCSGSCSRLLSELAIQRWLQHARLGPYDVIYLQCQQLAPRAALGLAGPLFGKRLVYHTYDFYDPGTYPCYSRLEGHLTRRAACHLNGEYHRAYITRTLYRLRCPVLVVPPHLPANWPIPGRFEAGRRALGSRSSEDVILMLHGAPSDLRATGQLLTALARLPGRFRLAMTCALDDRLSATLGRLGIQDRVTCLGRLDYLQMFSRTVNADIGIMLHVNNDLGNFFQGPGRLTEYMACGLPILASHFTGLQVLVGRHRLGACADPGDPADIAARILEIEAGIRGGAFDRNAIRQCFLDRFAFDHWEPAVVAAFDAVLRSTPSPIPPVPDFSAQGSPAYTGPNAKGAPRQCSSS